MLNQPDKYPNIKFDMSMLTPLPSAILKISMNGITDPFAIMEIVARNMLSQQLELQCTTWILIRDIYEAVKMDRDLHIFLDMLLIASKLDVDEFGEYYKEEDCRSLSNQEYFEEKFLMNFLVEVKSRLTRRDIVSADQRICNEVKQFLTRRPILSAFEDGLQKLGLESNTSEIKNYINNMEILFCKSLGLVQGMALRNGILISMYSVDPYSLVEVDLKDLVLRVLLKQDAIKLKAWLITKCSHETAHFLARSISGDFNFASPKFCKDRDPEYETKLFELGRHVELKMFGMQPDWIRSSEEAANDFIHMALTGTELPLIRPQRPGYLKKRNKPSLCFAGDIEYVDFGVDIDID
ncbi:hypothetical protein HA402_012854 [Bradysia odoriphaga]|nr:hypothetical protein HA402_012854 [Bradysia odoriphaga]